MELFGYLAIDVWDKDLGNPDDFLGRVLIPFREIPTDSHSPKNVWYDLTRRSTKDTVRGQLCVRVELEVDSGMVSERYDPVCGVGGMNLCVWSGRYELVCMEWAVRTNLIMIDRQFARYNAPGKLSLSHSNHTLQPECLTP